MISSTIGTVRKAYAVKSAFDRLQKLEQTPGGLSEKEKKKAEERCAEAAMTALWSGARLEIEGVVGDVCNGVLSMDSGPGHHDSDLTLEQIIIRRIEALCILGEVFSRVEADEFLHVEH